jgi:hypothetical protein
MPVNIDFTPGEFLVGISREKSGIEPTIYNFRSPWGQFIAYFSFLIESKAARRIYCVKHHHAAQG